MKTTLSDGRTFRISFRHTRDTSNPHISPEAAQRISDNLSRLEDMLGVRAFRLNGGTECFVWEHGKPRPDVPQGLSGQSIYDEWDPEIGRRISLGRALQHVFPKTTPQWKANRQALWDAYFSRGLEEAQRQLEAALRAGEPVALP